MANYFYKIKTYYRNGISYVLGSERVFGPPIHVHVEITNICNFRCVYCPQSLPDEHFKILGRGKMSLDTFRRIVDKLTLRYNIERLILTRDGEPLVHPRLEEFIKYARSRIPIVTLSSNGSLLTEHRADALIASGLSMMKGDFCYDKNLYEDLRVGGSYDKTLQGYLNILKAAKKRNVFFQLVILDLASYQYDNTSEILDSVERLKTLFAGFEPWIGVGPSTMHNALDESLQNLSKNTAKKSQVYNRCHHPWLEMVLDYRGNVVGCCRDLRSEYIVGNILEFDDPDLLWNGERMRSLRKNLKTKQPERVNICSKCDLPYGKSYAGGSLKEKLFGFLRK